MGSASDYIRLPSSEVRLEIILSLGKGPKVLSELKEDMDRRSTTILHALNDLAEINIVTQVDKEYQLTPIGKVEAALLTESYDTAQVLEKFNDFWLTHDLSGIPKNLLIRMGALKEAELIRSGEVNLGRVHQEFLRLLKYSKVIKGISPIFHPDYLEIIEEVLKKDGRVELILTEKVMEKIASLIDVSILFPFLEKEKLRIFINKDIRLALTVTDKVLSLGLFIIEDGYDYNTDLVTPDSRAREWGSELYEYYRERSKAFNNI
jgi:predicted transcriptional regulator